MLITPTEYINNTLSLVDKYRCMIVHTNTSKSIDLSNKSTNRVRSCGLP